MQPTAKGARGALRPFKPITFGRFTLVAPIAQGGMGEIFLAKSTFAGGLEKLCVIKKVIPALAHDEEFIGRFLDEARLLVKLQHGSIAQVYDTGREGDEYWIALEFVDGKDVRRLEQKARESKTRIPFDCIAYLGTKVLEALAYAHRKKDESGREMNLVHRDISPQNVLVSYEGEVKVIDFGLAKSKLSSGRTQPSMVMGKFFYMAPEQARNQPIDRRTDLYAVGVLLWELVAGKNPHEEVPPFEIMERVARPQIPAIETIVTDCPPSLAAVIGKALQVDPAQRFSSAEEMRGRLSAALYEISVDAGPERLSLVLREQFAEEFGRERRMIASFSQSEEQQPQEVMVPVDEKLGFGERTESIEVTRGEFHPPTAATTVGPAPEAPAHVTAKLHAARGDATAVAPAPLPPTAAGASVTAKQHVVADPAAAPVQPASAVAPAPTEPPTAEQLAHHTMRFDTDKRAFVPAGAPTPSAPRPGLATRDASGLAIARWDIPPPAAPTSPSEAPSGPKPWEAGSAAARAAAEAGTGPMPWDPASGAMPAAAAEAPAAEAGGWASSPTERWDPPEAAAPLPWDRAEPTPASPPSVEVSAAAMDLPSFTPSGRFAAAEADADPTPAQEPPPPEPKKPAASPLPATARPATTARGKAIVREERQPSPAVQRSTQPPRDADEASLPGAPRTQSGLGRIPSSAARATPQERPRRTGLFVGLAVVIGAVAALGLWVVWQRQQVPVEPPPEPPPSPFAFKPEPKHLTQPPVTGADAGTPAPAVAEAPDAGVAPIAATPDAGAEAPPAPDAGVAAVVAPVKPPEPNKPKAPAARPDKPDEPRAEKPEKDDRKGRLVARHAKLEAEYEAFVKQWGTAKVGSFVNSAHDRVASSFQRWLDSPDRHDELDRQLDDLRNALQERKKQLEKR